MEALKQHQVDGIAFLRDRVRGCLYDEPGLGKSRQAIEASEGRTLIVAPQMALDGGTWWYEDDEIPGEIQKWADDPDRFTTVGYTALNPRKQVGVSKAGQAVYAPDKNKVKPEYLGHWDTVVLDESHYIKGRKTSWTLAVDKIVQQADRVYPMTGTPIPNWAHESFTTLRLMYPGQAHPGKKYGSYWRWAGLWFDTSPTMFSQGMPSIGDLLGCLRDDIEVCRARPVWDPCEHWIEFMRANFKDKWLRRLREDCLDLPPLTSQTIQVPMTGRHLTIYRQMKKDYLTTVSGNEVVTWNSGSRNVALDKITTSPWLLAPEGTPRGGKFDRLAWDLTSRSRPTFVLAHYQDTVEACARLADSLGARAGYVHGGVGSEAAGRAIRDFKRGRLDVLVGSLEKVTESLQFTAADMVIFVEKSYKTYRNTQAWMRVHRMGQTRPVTVLDYVTPNSVDSHKRTRLAAKTEHQVKAMTAAEFGSLL